MAMTSDLVSATIAARAREPEGLRKMMMLSAVAHSIAIVAIVIGPWLFGAHRPQETIMEVSFNSGAPGADTGGIERFNNLVAFLSQCAMKHHGQTIVTAFVSRFGAIQDLDSFNSAKGAFQFGEMLFADPKYIMNFRHLLAS